MEDSKLRSALSGKRVAIVGDVMLDRYIVGRVDRMSPEAPVPVLLKEKEQARLGGAANVALNIFQLESTPIICSIIGKDDAGVELSRQLNEINTGGHYLVESENRCTTVKTRLIGNQQHLLRLDSETKKNLSEIEQDQILDQFEKMIEEQPIDLVILQDYNKGLLTKDLIENVISICNEKNIFVAVDPKFDNFFAYKNASFFKPNLKEISQAIGELVHPEMTALDAIGKDLIRRLNLSYAMMTLSEKGIYLKKRAEAAVICPAEKDEIVDVCGAGDAVLAVSALMLQSGLGVEDVGHVANKAGKLVCQKLGVAPVDLRELIKDV